MMIQKINNTNINQGMMAGKIVREDILKSENKKIDKELKSLKGSYNGR